MIHFRERWPTFVGIGGALMILALFGLTGLSDRADDGDWRLLGIAINSWGLALLALSLFLSFQLVLNARVSLRRERRLVETAAALREATARFEGLAVTDTLTGLPNRRAFSQLLGLEFRRSLRYGRPLALLMIDLDHFKQANDRHGHPFGDFVLVKTASVIRDAVRESDFVARYGGEEFVVMLPETTTDEAMVVAEKLRHAMAARAFTHGSTTAHMTLSVGVSALPSSSVSDEGALIDRADTALYAAKRGGRDRVVAASDTTRDSRSPEARQA